MCNSSDRLESYVVPPKTGSTPDEYVVLCTMCLGQVEQPETIIPNHWRCLNESIWNPNPVVQVLAYRMLKKLNNEEWAEDLMGMIDMDDTTREWAVYEDNYITEKIIHKDCNGQTLSSGDTVVLIKDLNVKGTSFIAKRGTAVRKISLVYDNADHIEGKVNSQKLILLTKFVRKT